VALAADKDTSSGPLVGKVIATSFLGATSRVTVDLGDTTVLAQLTTAEATTLPPGTRVRLVLRPDPVLIARDETASTEA
jgi:putative spermidine/putrescine transport system ATP-binding protein